MKKEHGKYLINIYTVLVFVILLASLITGPVMDVISKQPNSFHDFLVGIPAYHDTNKTGEWKFFWIIMILGSIVTGVLSFFDHTQVCESRKEQKWNRLLTALMGLCPVLIQYLIYGQTGKNYLVLSVIFFVILLVFEEKAISEIALFIQIYFAGWGISTLVAIFFRSYVLGDTKVLWISVFGYLGTVGMRIVCCRKSIERELRENMKKAEEKKAWKYFNFGIQLLTPLLLLVYLKQDYSYQGKVFALEFPDSYSVLIILLMMVLYAGNLLQVLPQRAAGNKAGDAEYTKKASVKKNLSHTRFSTIFSVFAFVSYLSPAMIMQTDLHHHGEQILAFQQIFELGQKSFAEYYPASGMFPVVIGAVNRFLFGKTAITYGMSYVLVALLFELLIMYLLYRRVGGDIALIIAMTFHMPVYCRTWIILPALLILCQRKWKGYNALWLFVWVLVCYGCGLYYPLFGAAVLLATLPIGVTKLYQYVKNKEWKRTDLLLVGSLCLLIIPAIPFLLRMLKHVLTMSSQTINVDGIAVWKGEVPDWFLPYMTNVFGRESIYHMARLLLGCVFVWLFTYLLSRYFQVKRKEKGKNIKQIFCHIDFLSLLSIPILLCVCYSYTMVCMDEDWVGNLLSRSDHVILWICGIWGFILVREIGDEILSKNQRRICCSLLLCIPALFFLTCEDYQFPTLEGTTDSGAYTVGEYASKLLPYPVREGQVIVTPQLKEKYEFVEFDRIGDGFIYESVLEKLNKYEATMIILRSYDPKIKMLGFEESQFYYYLMNEKCVYSGRTAIAKSKEAAETVMETVDIEHTAVRSGVSPLEEYYLYRYFEKAGYKYASDLDVFIPPKLYRAIYGEEGSCENSVWTNPYDLQYVAASFGKSVTEMEYLKQVYEDCEVQTEWSLSEPGVFTVNLTEPVSGKKCDFIYLSFENAKDLEASIQFTNEEPLKGCCEEYFRMGEGELLIPIGMNANWLDGTHDRLQISVEGLEKEELPKLREMKFYQLAG